MIRTARATDAPAIAAIWNPIIRDTLVTFTTDEKSVEEIAGLVAGPLPMLVAAEGDRVLGFARVTPFRPGPGYRHTGEQTVHLAPGARGRGTGRALLSALADAGRGQGLHSLWAGISAENPDAVAFHAACGYQHVARLPEVGEKFGRRLDLVLMRRLL